MFSDPLRKIGELPLKTLLGVAAVLVIVCQLVAMALVVDGLVAKAKARDAHHANEQMAVVQCMESSVGVARHSCIQQVATASASAQVYDSRQGRDGERALMPAAPQVQGFMPAAFAAR